MARLSPGDAVLCFDDRSRVLALDALVQVLQGRMLDRRLVRRASLVSTTAPLDSK